MSVPSSFLYAVAQELDAFHEEQPVVRVFGAPHTRYYKLLTKWHPDYMQTEALAKDLGGRVLSMFNREKYEVRSEEE